jgi:hypothetical protein
MSRGDLERAVADAKAELEAARTRRDAHGQHRDHSRAGAAPVAGGYIGGDDADAAVDAARAAHIAAIKALKAAS